MILVGCGGQVNSYLYGSHLGNELGGERHAFGERGECGIALRSRTWLIFSLALLGRAQQAGAPTAGKSTAKTQCYTGPVVNPRPLRPQRLD